MTSENVGTQTVNSQIGESKNKSTQIHLKRKIKEIKVDKRKQTDFTIRPIKSCEFEVFGIVQGVSFRHYTLRRAQKLDVRGWCMDSNRGTIKGVIQGIPSSFEAMCIWLKHTGSPTSRIDKCVFGPTEDLDEFTYEDFTIHLK